MDTVIFNWLNGWNGSSALFTDIIITLQQTVFKAVPFMLVFWALWFWPKTPEHRTEVRESLTAALICTVPIMVITRLIANYATFSPRPIHTPNFEIKLYDGQPVELLDGWSSFPSDHASLFLGFAVAIFTIHRKAGLFLILWAIFVPSVPRIILGMHWPVDIVAGWLLGAALALLLMRPVTRLLRVTGIVRFFEAREMLGYPLLFLATFEFSRMFVGVREVIEALM
jgi:undecaprenyl-diphosphatase